MRWVFFFGGYTQKNPRVFFGYVPECLNSGHVCCSLLPGSKILHDTRQGLNNAHYYTYYIYNDSGLAGRCSGEQVLML